jgi:hypothetical protein
MPIDLELDVDALQALADEQQNLEFEANNQCTFTCLFSCYVSCGYTAAG